MTPLVRCLYRQPHGCTIEWMKRVNMNIQRSFAPKLLPVTEQKLPKKPYKMGENRKKFVKRRKRLKTFSHMLGGWISISGWIVCREWTNCRRWTIRII